MIRIRSMFGNPNWGDWTFNKILVSWLYGENFEFVDCMKFNTHRSGDITLAGSILNFAGKGSISWGTGIIGEGAIPYDNDVEILAVRGPLTKRVLEEYGFSCPSIFGDPGLLVKNIYFPKKEKRYKLGYIPHYIDKDLECVQRIKNNPDILVIDICSGFKEVLDDICKCEVIASSSLHGLVIAQSYNIPYTWLRLSNKICGGEFKFRDFFQSCGDKDTKFCHNDSTIDEIINMAHVLETPNLDKLLEVCPIKSV